MKANFCQKCGTKLVPTMIEGRMLGQCPCGWIDWDAPLTVAVALIEMESGIVLVQRGLPPIDKWCLPAGFLNTGETPKEGCERETLEESGLIIVVPEIPFAIRKVPNGNQNLHFFLPTSVTGVMKPGSDAKAVKVFSPDALPDMAFPLHTTVIAEHFARKAKAA